MHMSSLIKEYSSLLTALACRTLRVVAVVRLKICVMAPTELKAGFRHMTGFSTPRHKLLCAVSEGVLPGLARRSHPRKLSYKVPQNASRREQQVPRGSQR